MINVFEIIDIRDELDIKRIDSSRLITEHSYSILFKSNIKLTRWLEKAHL